MGLGLSICLRNHGSLVRVSGIDDFMEKGYLWTETAGSAVKDLHHEE
jgi:hypothetical protein